MIPALMPTYARENLVFDHGDGAWLVTAEGHRYLDFGAGIATSSLGHAHPHLVAAIAEQAARVMHVSNLYRVPGAERFAERLTEASFADSVFLCNSGAEANERHDQNGPARDGGHGPAGAVADDLLRGRVPRPARWRCSLPPATPNT